MSHFSFQYPIAFILLAIFWVCGKYCVARSEAIYFPHIAKLLQANGVQSMLLFWLKWLGIITLIIALASPVITNSYKNNKKSARDIMLILDSSNSMREMGFDRSSIGKTRFDVVKEVVGDFVARRKQDRVGLVTFADVAFVASPLTFEQDFLKEMVGMQRIGVAGARTAINDALLQTYSVLSKSKAKSKVAILLTDGSENMSKTSPSEIVGLIENSDIKLYTIGIGGAFRGADHRYLKLLAKRGHGKFYSASEQRKLEAIYDEIDKLEETKIDAKKIIQRDYLYIYPLFLSIFAWLLLIYFRSAKGVVK